jgi:hypothetical protein
VYNSHELKQFIEKLEKDRLRLTDYGSLLTCLKGLTEELERLNKVCNGHEKALETIRGLSIKRVGLPAVEGNGFMS